MQRIADNIKHHDRKNILLKWLPAAKEDINSKEFKMLWDAYFVYIDPNGVPMENCPACRAGVLKNWKDLTPYLVEAEKEYNELENL